MPIDALTLGIGLQGKHDFNLDGLKYQLEQQQAKAKADAKANKDAWDSYSDPLKDAMATMDASKIKPYLQQKAKTQFAETISKINERRKNGSTYGAKDIEDIQNLTFNLQKMYQESKGWDQVENPHPKLKEWVNDPQGYDKLVSEGPFYGADISPYQDGGYSISGSGMVDYDAIAKSAYEGIADADLIEAIGKPTSKTIGDKVVQEQVYGLPKDAASVREDQVYSQIVNTPGALLKFMTDMGYEGLKPDLYENGPSGVGVVLKPEVAQKVRDYAKSVTGRYVKKGTLSDQPSGTGKPTFNTGSGSGETKDYTFEFVKSSPVITGEGPVFEDIELVGGLRTQYKGKTPKTFNMQLPNGSYELGNKGVQKLDNKSTGRTISASAVQSDVDKDGNFWYTVQSISQEAPKEQIKKRESLLSIGDEKGAQEIMDDLIRDKYVNTYIIPENDKVKSDFFSGIGVQGEEMRNKIQEQIKGKYLGKTQNKGTEEEKKTNYTKTQNEALAAFESQLGRKPTESELKKILEKYK